MSKAIITAPPTTQIPIPTQSIEDALEDAASSSPAVLFRDTGNSRDAASSTVLEIAHIVIEVSMKSSSRFSRLEL